MYAEQTWVLWKLFGEWRESVWGRVKITKFMANIINIHTNQLLEGNSKPLILSWFFYFYLFLKYYYYYLRYY